MDKYISQFPSGSISSRQTHSRLKRKGHVKIKLGKKLPSLSPSLDTPSTLSNNTTGYSNKPENGNSNVSSYMKVKPYTHIHTLIGACQWSQ